ncbi:MAG: LysE family transporter [Brevinema sp.]
MLNWAAFLSYIFISAYTPGPNNITCMNNGIRMGLRKSIGYCFGVLVGSFVMMMLLSTFGSHLWKEFPSIKPVIQGLGALYLLWLAHSVWTSTGKSNVENVAPHTFWPSFFIQFINIKGIFFAFTTSTTFIVPNFDSWTMITLMTILISSIGFSGAIVWGLFGSIFQKFLLKHEKTSNTVMALLLVYCAIMLFL